MKGTQAAERLGRAAAAVFPWSSAARALQLQTESIRCPCCMLRETEAAGVGICSRSVAKPRSPVAPKSTRLLCLHLPGVGLAPHPGLS